MVHEDRAAVFTGTFFETGQSITVCAECLIDFAKALASPPPGEAPADADAETAGDVESDATEGPTPDAGPPSSGSHESSPGDTTPDHVEAASSGEPETNGAVAADHELEGELNTSPSE